MKALLNLRKLLPVPALAALLLLSGCGFEHLNSGPMEEQPLSIDLGDTERANIELDLGAGELNLTGGGDNLVSGEFQYNNPALKPVIQTSRNGSHAAVTIRTQPGHSAGRGVKSIWNLQISSKPLLDLSVNCGAGQDKLNLREVALRSLKVSMGAGQVDLDLRGEPARDYDVDVSGGVGQATVRLPQGVGIRAEAHGGLGSINVTGLQKVGDHYENSLYDKAKVNLRLKVQGGIGEINILGA